LYSLKILWIYKELKMKVNLRVTDFANVNAGQFESDTPKSANSTHREGRIVRIHVITDQDVTCDLIFCRKEIDISTETLETSSTFAWVEFSTTILDPAGLRHMGAEVNIPFNLEKLNSDFYILLRNTGAVQANFRVKLTLEV
jgi:hypothetical protein